MRWKHENDFDDVVRESARRHNVPAALIKALISLESEFDVRARRVEPGRPSLPPTVDHPAGGDESIGLMQLLVRTARLLGYHGTITDLYNPATNVELGTRLLADAIDGARARKQPLTAALSAYNGGYRPALGFGAVFTPATLASYNASRARAHLPMLSAARVGTYNNQNYVNVVTSRVEYFSRLGWDSGGIVPAVVAVALVVLGAHAALHFARVEV